VSQMRMAAAAVSPLILQPAIVLFPGWLGGCLSFEIGFRSVGTFGLFCVALTVDASFSPGRCCAALVCCILCV